MSGSATVAATVLDGFDHLPAGTWDDLRSRGATDVVFLTRGWATAWWRCHGRGELLLTLVERDGRPALLAPLYADGGMLFLVGSGSSDQLDLLGETADPALVAAAIAAAAARVPGFVGLRLYHVPAASPTLGVLDDVAERLGLVAVDEGELVAPVLALGDDGEAGREAAGRTSLRRHHRWFDREGELVVRHLRRADEVAPWLDPFFDQHVRRWDGTGSPSLFVDDRERAFYRAITQEGGAEGWLRFTAVTWDDQLIAAHLGARHAGRYLWYKPTFEPDLASRSPGEVLLRSLFLAAVEEGATVFDFGIGDERFKHRFASDTPVVRTVGLYPREVLG